VPAGCDSVFEAWRPQMQLFRCSLAALRASYPVVVLRGSDEGDKGSAGEEPGGRRARATAGRSASYVGRAGGGDRKFGWRGASLVAHSWSSAASDRPCRQADHVVEVLPRL